MELIKNPKFVMIGEFKELKTRDDFKKELELIDKKIDEKSYTNLPSVLISYEVGFKESDITCFIGRVLSDDLKTNYGFINKLQSMGLEVLTDNVVETLLHTSSNDEVIDAYKEMIKYANNNNIQIRGEFIEIYNSDKTDIYVEAYDLTKDNEDALIHEKHLEKKIKTTEPIYDSKYVSKWGLQGQVVEPIKIFNSNKKHFMPDTKYKELILYKDGTTNYDNVTWRDNHLLIKNNGKIVYNYLYQENSKDGTKYLVIAMNDLNINVRPYLYYYKEVK